MCMRTSLVHSIEQFPPNCSFFDPFYRILNGTMTLRARNRFILYTALAVLFVAAVLAVVVGVFVWSNGGPRTVFDAVSELAEARSLYGVSVPTSGAGPVGVFLSPLIPVPIAVGAALLTRRYFRSSVTPTIFFVTLSMVLSGLTVIRFAQIILPGYGVSSTYAATLSRAVYAAHIAGALALFTASIYAAGAQYTRIWGAMIAVVTIALAFAYVLPVDAFQLDEALLHRLEARGNIQLITGALAALTLVNFLRYGIEAEESARVVVPLGILAILVSRELLFYVSGLPLHLATGVLYVVGFALFARNSYAVYLWT